MKNLKKRITVLFFGTTGSGPVYSYEMAKALMNTHQCQLQIIVAKGMENLNRWKETFSSREDIEFFLFDPYERTKLSATCSMLDFRKQNRLVRLIEDFHPEMLYVPFGLLWASYIYKKLYGKTRIVITKHDVVLHDSWKNLNEFFYSLFNKGSEKYVNDIIVLSKKQAELASELYKLPVHIIPHASFDYYFDDNTIEKKTIYRTIGFIGRIEIYKGIDLLVEAFEKIKNKDIRLVIAGSGKIEADLLHRIQSNPMIELINRYLKEEEIPQILSRVDFLVLPYKRASQSGVIPLAFAAGKTVVATNVGSLSEQIGEGNAILTDVDSDMIAAEIDNLYLDESKILEMGASAKRFAVDRMSWKKSAELLLEML